MMALVLCLNALFFLFMGLFFKADTLLNISMKFICCTLFVGNMFIILKESGYIVKVH